MRSYSTALSSTHIATSKFQTINTTNKFKTARTPLHICPHRKNSAVSICLLAFDKLAVSRPLRARELKMSTILLRFDVGL